MDDRQSGGCRIVETDKDGNIHLISYDVVAHKSFDKADFYIPCYANNKKAVLGWSNLKSIDTAPEFPSDADITVENNDEDTTIVFPDAQGRFYTECYIIDITNAEKAEYSKCVFGSYSHADGDGLRINVGKLGQGSHKIKITPCSPYSKTGRTLIKVIEV